MSTNEADLRRYVQPPQAVLGGVYLSVPPGTTMEQIIEQLDRDTRAVRVMPFRPLTVNGEPRFPDTNTLPP